MTKVDPSLPTPCQNQHRPTRETRTLSCFQVDQSTFKPFKCVNHLDGGGGTVLAERQGKPEGQWGSVCGWLDSIVHGFLPLLVQQAGTDQGLGHAVRVAVGRWAAVLKVTLLLLADAAGDADAGAAVGHARRELVDVGGFVAAGEAAGVVQPPLGVVGTDVVTVPLPELLNGLLDGPENRRGGRGGGEIFLTLEREHEGSNGTRGLWYSLQSTLFPHLLGAEVCMAASTVPVPWDWLGVKRGNDTKVFTDAVQEETCHPQMVAHADPLTRANLELPLKHTFPVGWCALTTTNLYISHLHKTSGTVT